MLRRNQLRVRSANPVLLVVALALWALLPNGVASAQDEVVVDVVAPCAESQSVLSEIEGLLGRPLQRAGTIARARLDIDGRRGSWRGLLVLERDGIASERELTARSCERLASAAALMLALALDPALSGAAPEPVLPPPQAEPEIEHVVNDLPVAPIAVAPPPEVRVQAPTSEAEVQVGLGLGGGIEAGALAEVAPSLRVSGAVGFGALRVELDAAFVLPTMAYGLQPGATVETWLAFGALRVAAGWWPLQRLGLYGGLELELGAAHANAGGVRVDNATSAVLPWAAVGVVVLGELQVAGPLALRARVAAGTPLVAPAFEIRPAGPLDRPASVLFSTGLSLRVWLS